MDFSNANKVNKAYFKKAIYSKEIDSSQTDFMVNTLSEFPNNSEMAIGIINSKEVFYGLKRTYDTINIVSNSDRLFMIGLITKVL